MTATATAGYHWLTHCTSRPVELVAETLGGLGAPERPGGFGQPHHRVHQSGLRVYCGSDRPGQPVVIDAPGEVCEGWAGDVLKWCDDLGCWTTRVDVAIDVEPPELARGRMLQMRRAWMAGKCETRMRRESFSEQRSYGEGEGFTFYFGGKTAALRTRAYDRRGPLRVEHQWRPSREIGEVLPEMMARKGPVHYWRTLAQAINFPMEWYQQLLKGDSQILPGEVRTSSSLGDTMAHLNQQFGVTFWALAKLGLTLADLTTVPKQLRGSQASRLLSWAASGEKMGLKGQQLRADVEEVLCRKSK